MISSACTPRRAARRDKPMRLAILAYAPRATRLPRDHCRGAAHLVSGSADDQLS
ncbi:MAG: hypothetical protein HY052_06440 [Proteobacteria bacterium]|nr:hypothetical protein [Pseudomonadota bacterium]